MLKKIDFATGTDRGRNLRVRLSLMIVDDTDEEQVFSEQYHSVSIAPDDDVETVLAEVTAHLSKPFSESQMPGAPWPSLTTEQIAEIKALAGVIHTPERKAKSVTKKEAARARAEILSKPAPDQPRAPEVLQ